MALRQKSAKLQISGGGLPHTFSNAFPSAPTVGQTVFFICTHYATPNITGVTIAGAAATLDHRYQADAQVTLEVWRATVPASPDRHVVMSGSSSGHYITGSAFEVDALAATPLDRTGTTEGYAAAPTTATALATTQADELVIAQWTPAFGASDIGTDTATGYTEGWVEDDSNTYQGGAGSFKFVSATGVQSATWAMSGGANSYYAHIVTYKLAESGGGGDNTGTGAVTTDAATVAGAGVATTTVTGAVTTGASTVSGAGVATTTATGAVTTGAATVSGGSTNFATGAVTTDATVSAAGGGGVTASGNVTTDASVAATGAATTPGTGAVTTDATVSGAAIASNVGTGAVTTDATVSANEGQVVVGTGSVTTDDAVAAGAAVASTTGAGAVTTDATASGAAAATTTATGAVTTDASVSGTAAQDDTLIGSGSVTTDAATVVGAAIAAIPGVGGVTTDDAAAAGAAVASNVGAGAVTTDATVSGTSGAGNAATGNISTENASVSGYGGQFAPTIRAIRVNLPAMTRKIIIPSRLRRIFF